jgi:deoxyribonuclease V
LGWCFIIGRGPSEDYVRRRVPRGFRLETARRIQAVLSSRVVEEDLVGDVRLVCGLDVAYVRGTREVGVAVAVNYSVQEQRVVEEAYWVGEVNFPYVPTLLSFRELKPIVNAYMRLRTRPDVVLVDGHGRAHPYGLGIASHFGVTMGIPTVGVAKSLLYGEVEGDIIKDPRNGKVLGALVHCSSKPTYVSIGHGLSLAKAVDLVRKLCVGSTMPLPILRAHELAKSLKRKTS